MNNLTSALPDPVEALLHEAASWLLPGSPCITASVTGAEADRLIHRATQERLLGPLLMAVDAGELVLPEPVVEELVDRQRRALLWCLHLEVRLLEVREWFDEAGGVEHLLVKGPAIAHLDESDPSLRTFADLDLLIASPSIDRAVEVLVGHGATRPWPQRRPGYDRRFAKSVTMTCPDGVEIDIHRSLCDGAHGFRIPLDRLFDARESFDLGGEAVAVLSPVHRLLHAAYHAVLGSQSPRLMSLRDLAGYLTYHDLGPDVVLPEARLWRGEAVLAEAVRAALGAFSFDAPGWQAWVDRYEMDPCERVIIDRERVEGSSLGPAKLDAFRELPRVGDQAAFAVALVWPTAEHLKSRGLRRCDLFAGLGRMARRR